jgi:hypothetical protein
VRSHSLRHLGAFVFARLAAFDPPVLTPHPTRAESLGHAYEIGTRVGQATTVLAVLLAVLIGTLVWRRSLRIKAEKDVLLAVGKRPLGVLPFAALLVGAGLLFLVLFCTVTLRLALSQGEGDGSTSESPPTALGGELTGKETTTAHDELGSLRIVLDGTGITVQGKLVAPPPISSDKLGQIEPVAAVIHEFHARREALEAPGMARPLRLVGPAKGALGALFPIIAKPVSSAGGFAPRLASVPGLTRWRGAARGPL